MTIKPKKTDDVAAGEAFTVPAINVDDDFVGFVRGEMDDAHADIQRLTGIKIAREMHYTQAIDRIIAARDAEFNAIDNQIARHTRKHEGCSAALQNMKAEPATKRSADVVSITSSEDQRDVA